MSSKKVVSITHLPKFLTPPCTNLTFTLKSLMLMVFIQTLSQFLPNSLINSLFGFDCNLNNCGREPSTTLDTLSDLKTKHFLFQKKNQVLND